MVLKAVDRPKMAARVTCLGGPNAAFRYVYLWSVPRHRAAGAAEGEDLLHLTLSYTELILILRETDGEMIISHLLNFNKPRSVHVDH